MLANTSVAVYDTGSKQYPSPPFDPSDSYPEYPFARLGRVSEQHNPVYASMRHFSVSILAAEDRAVSDRFARASGENKWQGVKHRLGEGGVPVLEEALAAFECEVEARYEAGDHVIVLGRVLRFACEANREPLLFHGSHYHRLGPRYDSWVDLESLIGWG